MEKCMEVECEKYVPTEDDVAIDLQYNITAEADAIEKYNHLIKLIQDSKLPASKKEVIYSNIYEIIGDELNHQERLSSLYTLVTGIKASKD